jgi:hypothetical protein
MKDKFEVEFYLTDFDTDYTIQSADRFEVIGLATVPSCAQSNALAYLWSVTSDGLENFKLSSSSNDQRTLLIPSYSLQVHDLTQSSNFYSKMNVLSWDIITIFLTLIIPRLL